MKTLGFIFGIGVVYTLISDEISIGLSILLSIVCVLAIIGESALNIK